MKEDSKMEKPVIGKIEIQITKRFGKKTVLDNFTLNVKGKEFVTLLGPSGCGKTTALNCVAGLVPLSEGRILVDGERLDTIPPEKRGIGMVFQNYALFPHMTVFKNISFGLELQKRPSEEIKSRVEEVLSLVRLQGFEDRFPGQLSGGQQQRVAIARALAPRPKLLLLDEPLSNLDAKLRLDMRGELKNLHRELGLTSIYVTHDQSEALSLSDRIAVIHEGIIQQIGIPKEIYESPANLFVADFMGCENFFTLKIKAVESDGKTALLEQNGFRLRLSNIPQPKIGEEITLTIRPDDIQVIYPQSMASPIQTKEESNTVQGVVNVVQYLGKENDIEVFLENNKKIRVRSSEKVDRGDKITLYFKPEKILFIPKE
jgi:putative spermidine/putrescine transport system ATP-binding protein